MSDTTTGATLLRKTRHAVEGFLIELQEMTPDKLDCLALERSAMKVVLELGLGMMKEVFRRADEDAPEVVVNGSRWGNRVVSNGTYVTKFGSFTQDRSGYQQSGRGRALFPVDLCVRRPIVNTDSRAS